MKDEVILEKLYLILNTKEADKKDKLIKEFIMTTEVAIQTATNETIGFGKSDEIIGKWIKAARIVGDLYPVIFDGLGHYCVSHKDCIVIGRETGMACKPFISQSQYTEKAAEIKHAIKTATEFLNLPSRAEVDAFIKIQRAKHKGRKVVYDFGLGLPSVDASDLKDMLTLFPGCRVATCSDEKGPICFELWGREGLLYPVNKQ